MKLEIKLILSYYLKAKEKQSTKSSEYEIDRYEKPLVFHLIFYCMM